MLHRLAANRRVAPFEGLGVQAWGCTPYSYQSDPTWDLHLMPDLLSPLRHMPDLLSPLRHFDVCSSRALCRMSDLLSPLRHEPDLLSPLKAFLFDAPPDSLFPVVVPPLRPPA